jgi:ferric-dicitrate binding protein FerR (iron transport regulator)
MTPQVRPATGFIRRLVIRASVMRCNSAMSAALRVLILGVPLLYPAAQDRVHTYCRVTALDQPGEISLLEEGITLAPQSRVSVQKTAKALLIHVLKGEVLFNRRESSDYPVVVTAGNARISNIEAVICVGVEKERTVIAVLEGATEMSALGADRPSHAMNEVTLRTGDQVELRRVGPDVVLHFATDEVGGRGSCGAGILRRVWGIR